MLTDPDHGLLLEFVGSDRAAFETLSRTFEHEVHRWILRIVRDRSTAEDGVIEEWKPLVRCRFIHYC